MKRAARSMRSGSSVNETSGARGVRSRRCGEVAHASERVDQFELAAGTVPWR